MHYSTFKTAAGVNPHRRHSLPCITLPSKQLLASTPIVDIPCHALLYLQNSCWRQPPSSTFPAMHYSIFKTAAGVNPHRRHSLPCITLPSKQLLASTPIVDIPCHALLYLQNSCWRQPPSSTFPAMHYSIFKTAAGVNPHRRHSLPCITLPSKQLMEPIHILLYSFQKAPPKL